VSDFPDGWIDAVLSDVAFIQMGQSPDSSTYNEKGVGLPFFQGKAEFGKLFPTIRKWCSEPKKVAEAGDILLSVRAPVGPTNIAVERCCIGRGLTAIQAITPFNQQYLLHYFRYIQPWMSEQGTGTTFAAVSGEFIRNLNIPVAPLPEQKRIADNLDRLITRVDDCRDRLERIPLILKRFRQSVLLLAMSGELTADWRNVSQESVKWQNVRLSEICISIVDGTHQAPPQTESGIPFITISAINDGRLRIEKATRFVSSLYFEQLQPSRKPVIGDILFSVTGSIAITALVDVSEPFIFQRHIAILKPDSSQIVSEFLFYVLNSENIKRQSQEVATGTAQKTISISRLRAFEIDLPSIDEQIEVVNRIESLFSYADLLEERYKKAYIQVEQLTPTLLNMAFRGELVPQDPDDEPASVLLERIQISKAAQPIEPRVPTTRRSTMTRLSQESVKEVICQLPNDEFSFEELREKISGDYDLLKDIFFTLLDETDPIVKQVFNREAETMCFVRGSK
jgi:type I restriction enzyme, S subunit